ncbi:hypothetical protein [Lactiplantibacillus fabifermentans]|uniref:Uncharacterized protein n=2 Tax=Lactiplantibacillus fabifermentans TaxID=483011 RepID=A0A0R2NL65_9LACO|nr:hypothetical protein [Lactiplantibacillus fabifermentans]ETY73616.1 hypothetical protein LFAB_11135 [Lactiplantibacillus fabifermentans T30PCM01]KRO26472.1 hypothetical protein DY78_GL000937 [Lactiplantibacillus fabifermentans DSM 21115]
MVKAALQINQQNHARLQAQLMLTSSQPAIRKNVVLQRLIVRAGHRLQQGHDTGVVARQIAVDLGYYLFCHNYQMPRAAYDLLAVVQTIDASQPKTASIIPISR